MLPNKRRSISINSSDWKLLTSAMYTVIMKCTKAKIIVKPLGSGGTDDPLNQRATIGWKAMFTAVRLNELGICRVETGASAV